MGSCIARSGADVNIIGECRSQELTEALGQAMDLGRLWDQYGVVGDVTVSTLISHYQVIDNNKATFSLLECARTSLPPSQSFKPFTSAFPQADICEVITPNILHQVIKGTFKDHLVTWVEEYLILVHGKTDAAVILDDIDWR